MWVKFAIAAGLLLYSGEARAVDPPPLTYQLCVQDHAAAAVSDARKIARRCSRLPDIVTLLRQAIKDRNGSFHGYYRAGIAQLLSADKGLLLPEARDELDSYIVDMLQRLGRSAAGTQWLANHDTSVPN